LDSIITRYRHVSRPQGRPWRCHQILQIVTDGNEQSVEMIGSQLSKAGLSRQIFYAQGEIFGNCRQSLPALTVVMNTK
jgi:hypothetical protein